MEYDAVNIVLHICHPIHSYPFHYNDLSDRLKWMLLKYNAYK